MTPTTRAATAVLAVLASLALVPSAFAADGPPKPRSERVAFAKGASSATINGTIKGNDTVDYLVRAAAGQTLAVTMKAGSASAAYNVLPPGNAASGAAMFTSDLGGDFKAMLPADGDYAIRVYLARAAARRGASSPFTLTVAVDGTPLPPLPAARDAKVGGTAFHAVAKVPCTPPFDSKAQQCDAGVIRRGSDGTATVEVRGDNQVKRRLLLVKGQAIASDARDLSGAGSAKLDTTRDGDRITVKVGDDERYELVDALLTGG
jgi:hypothetical protein